MAKTLDKKEVQDLIELIYYQILTEEAKNRKGTDKESNVINKIVGSVSKVAFIPGIMKLFGLGNVLPVASIIVRTIVAILNIIYGHDWIEKNPPLIGKSE